MKIKFPAMQATIGQRTYYATVMKLSQIATMFSFIADWIEFTPEEREQRVLNEKRIPDITRYIVENEDGYLFSSITASYKSKEKFETVGTDGLGSLELDFGGDNFVINDGQHRCAAIRQAIRENPALRDESISVLLFPYENRQRVQQMFADLNRHVVKPNMATNIIFDHHDMLGRVTKEVCEGVTAFQGLVDNENQSLPARSEKAFTLYALYDATKELLTEKTTSGDGLFDDLVQTAIQYWTAVSNLMPDWLRVKNREIRPVELRQVNISTHSVVLRALGAVGAELMNGCPADWKDRLAGLRHINWNKRNRDWENVCMVANSVVANRQARVATKAYLKRKLGLPVSESEERSIEHLTMRDHNLPSPKSEMLLPPRAADQAQGEATPFSATEFDALLVEVLKELGGKAHIHEAEREAFERKKAIFSQPGWQKLEGGGVPKWKKRFEFAWDRAKKHGLGEPLEKTGRGIWQLTRKGWNSSAQAPNDRFD